MAGIFILQSMVECFSLKRVNPRMLLEEISDALLVLFEHSSIADVREVGVLSKLRTTSSVELAT